MRGPGNPASRVLRLLLPVLIAAAVTFAASCAFLDDPYAGRSRPQETSETGGETGDETSRDVREEKYEAARMLEELENYADAAQIYGSLGTYSDAPERTEECLRMQKDLYYEEAVRLFEGRLYADAKEYFLYLDGYLDSAEYAEKCDAGIVREKFWEVLSGLNPGEKTTFGRWEQDGNGRNGPEDAEWILLEKEEDRVLVAAARPLASLPLWNAGEETPEGGLLWTSSEPFGWMNGDFLENAFSGTEREMIAAGSETGETPLFLLSAEEAERYSDLILAADAGSGEDLSPWWLLPEPEAESFFAASAGEEGLSLSVFPQDEAHGVRPAFWIGH
ncbi:MAG: hypothetical protein ILO68_04525 [Clostridia bacterium]|nr:hypothetical protein [Clostridia bacterium]